MLKEIPLTRIEYDKQGSKWIPVLTTNKIVTEEYVNNIIMAKKFFSGLGGYERHEKDYTSYGFRVVRVISIRPDKQKKVVYEFDFDNAK